MSVFFSNSSSTRCGMCEEEKRFDENIAIPKDNEASKAIVKVK